MNATHELIHAAKEGDVAAAKAALAAGAEANGFPIQLSPLAWAIQAGSLEIVDLLLDHSADPNLLDADGDSPLYAAIVERQFAIAERLLNRGADVNYQCKNTEHSTPLHTAASYGLGEFIQLLVEHGANPDLKDELGNTAYDYAVRGGQQTAAKVLAQRRD
jgi:ankyrin repeat protein